MLVPILHLIWELNSESPELIFEGAHRSLYDTICCRPVWCYMVELDLVSATESPQTGGTEGASIVSNKNGGISGHLEMPEERIGDCWCCRRCHGKSKKIA